MVTNYGALAGELIPVCWMVPAFGDAVAQANLSSEPDHHFGRKEPEQKSRRPDRRIIDPSFA